MSRITVPPRDLQPGDKIDRIDKDTNLVQATVREVVKVRRQSRTAYKVYFTEYDALPDNRKAWAEHKHLAPVTFFPHQKVTVERVTVDDPHEFAPGDGKSQYADVCTVCGQHVTEHGEA